MLPIWHEEPIGKHHDRDTFDCGDEALNQFLHRHARQSHEKGGAKTYLAVSDSNEKVLGYYSLSPASIAYERMPKVIKRGLARHGAVPLLDAHLSLLLPFKTIHAALTTAGKL
jgi:hypothetical protein